jgi:hypothetical protein
VRFCCAFNLLQQGYAFAYVRYEEDGESPNDCMYFLVLERARVVKLKLSSMMTRVHFELIISWICLNDPFLRGG